MDSTTIALDRQAYELLKRQKHEGESFSDTVKRLARPRRRLASYAGAWADLPESVLHNIENIRSKGKESRARRRATLFASQRR